MKPATTEYDSSAETFQRLDGWQLSRALEAQNLIRWELLYLSQNTRRRATIRPAPALHPRRGRVTSTTALPR